MNKNYFLALILCLAFMGAKAQIMVTFSTDSAIDNGSTITETITQDGDTYILTADVSPNGAQLDDLSGGDLIFFADVDSNLEPWKISITKNGSPTNFTLTGIDFDTLDAGSITVVNQDNATISATTNYPFGAGAINITNTINATDITSFRIIPSDNDDLNNFGFHNIDVTFPSPDTDPPVVQSITLDGTPATDTASVDYIVTFDENANNITADDFSLTTTGSASGTIASVSASSGTTTTVTVNSLSGIGTVRLDLNASTDIADDASNSGVAAFSTGDSHTVNTAPTVTISSTESSPTTANPVPVTITFSENITGFDTISDITIGNGSISSITPITGNIFLINITPDSNPASITVDIAADVANATDDNVGNQAATQFSITYNDPTLGVGDLKDPVTGNDIVLTAGPNPTTDYVYFSTVLDSIKIYNVSGQLVATMAATDVANLGALNDGLYLIEGTLGSTSTTLKILKE